MSVAKMMRVREDVEIRPSSTKYVPVILENQDQALAYISEVTPAVAGYSVLPGSGTQPTLQESQPQMPTSLTTTK